MSLTNYEQFANAAQTTLSGSMTAGQLTIPVTTSAGFTGMAAGQFRVTIDAEILIVAAPVSGTTWTVLTRGAEGTTAATHAPSALVTQILTQGSLLNCPRSLALTGDLETLDSNGRMLNLPAGGTGQTQARTALTSLPPLHAVSHRGLSPMDYGALADGTLHPLSELYGSLPAAQADFPFVTSLTQSRDFAALQQCLNVAAGAGGANVGGNVYLPAGTYYLDTPISIHQTWGLNVRGDGDATTLNYYGTTASGCLNLVCCQECHFEHFRIVNLTGGNPVYGIQLTNEVTSNGYVSTGNLFDCIRINGAFTAAWYLTYQVSPGDQNNDLHRWLNCDANQFHVAGVKIHGTQCHDLRFEGMGFSTSAGTSGTYCIWSDLGAYLHIERCNLNACETAVRLDNFFPGPVTISHCNGENNRKVLEIAPGGGNTGSFPLTIESCRFSLAPQIGDYVVSLNNNGPVVIRGNTIDTNNAASAIAPLIGALGGLTSLEHVGNVWQIGFGTGTRWTSYGGAYYPNSTFNHPTFSLIDHGNLYHDQDGTEYRFDNRAADRTTPAALSADVNDYNPLRGTFQRWSSSQAVNVTGLECDPAAPNVNTNPNGISGEVRTIWNVGLYNITFKHQSALSKSVNRFFTTMGSDVTLTPNRYVVATWDYDSTCWRLAGPF